MPAYTVDYNSGSSAFHAGLLLAQAWHLNNCINRVLLQEQLLFAQRHGVHLSRAKEIAGFPRQVLVLAHSQGGVASRLAPLLPNFQNGTVAAMMLVNSPLQGHPFIADLRLATVNRIANSVWAAAAGVVPGKKLPRQRVSPGFAGMFDWLSGRRDKNSLLQAGSEEPGEALNAAISRPDLMQYYAQEASVPLDWLRTAASHTKDIAVLSMSTGGSDIVVRPELASMAGIGEPRRSISFLSHGVAGAWLGTLHDDVLACG